MLVYFAHPIDQTRNMQQIYPIRGLFKDLGVSIYRPGGAFDLAGPPGPELEQVDRINRFALAAADAVVAWLPPDVATLGVPAEIELAIQLDKPVAILTNGNLSRRSVQMVNWRIRGASVIEYNGDLHLADFLNLLSARPSDLAESLGDELWVGDLIPAPSRQPTTQPTLSVKLEPGARVPARGHHDDAGLDLAILNDEKLEAGTCRMLPTGVRAALPDGAWGLIIGRSSTWVKHGVDVRLAVIDAGYRGELMIQAHNQNNHMVSFPAGTRLAQYVVLPAWMGRVEALADGGELPEHARGTNGYGSTGP